MAQAKTFNVGDRVAYAAKWLKSVQAHERGRWRGTVTKTENFGAGQLCTIRWDDIRPTSDYHDDGLGRVISQNLTLVSRIAIDAALAG